MATKKSVPKKATKKKSAKRTVAKKSVRKRAASSSKKIVSKVTPKKTSDKANKSKTRLRASKGANEFVTLPDKMSDKTIAKAELLLDKFERHFGKPAYLVTYVSGICFVFVGLSIIFSGQHIVSLNQALVCTSTQCGDVIQTSDSETEPVLQVANVLPRSISDETRISFSVLNALGVTSKLDILSGSGLIDLKTERLSNTNFRTTIPNGLPSGVYRLRIYASAESGSGSYVFSAGTFEVPGSDSNVSDFPEEEKPFFRPAPVFREKVFELTPSGSELNGVTGLRITTPDGYSSVEVYVRPIGSDTKRFLGSAERLYDNWQFRLNTKNIPNGSYYLSATANSASGLTASPEVLVSISNTSLTLDSSGEGAQYSAETVPQEIERDFVSYDPKAAEGFEQTIKIEEDVRIETDRLLDENREQISTLVETYSVAVSAGDESLIYAAREELHERKEKIVTTVLLDSRTKDLAEQVDEELERRIGELQKKVEVFEALRLEREGELVIQDVDADGINDFDEIIVYGTDPKNPDTDNDGFTDGIEIVRGFDPLDSRAEIPLKYESPQETIGLERAEFSIKEVTPLIETDESLSTPRVQAVITGTGLPNSFVTLFIYSSPTIVTIKTDSDGSFVYTFEKELEDGEHEVYVAFTDNTGSIVAQSSPFQFVKKAEAFTPVGTLEEVSVTSGFSVETAASTSYGVTAGLGVIALGLILFMFGVSLRSNGPVHIISKNDSNNTTAT